MIDEGEADWKIICISVSDPMAERLNDIADVETHMPGFLDATRDWFKIYKMPTGKPANQFAADGKFYDRAFALDIIEHDHSCWLNLAKGGYECAPQKKRDICVESTCLGEEFVETQVQEWAEDASGLCFLMQRAFGSGFHLALPQLMEDEQNAALLRGSRT